MCVAAMAGGGAGQSKATRPRRVVVVGAGLAGVTAARAIAVRAAAQSVPVAVTVVDRHPAVGQGTSFQNAGRFCPTSLAGGGTSPEPSAIRLLMPGWLRTLCYELPSAADPRAPSLHWTTVAPAWSEWPSLAHWGLLKLDQGEQERARARRGFQLLAARSRTATARLITELGEAGTSEMSVRPGTLWLYRNAEGFASGVTRVSWLNQIGFSKAEALPSERALVQFPWLAGLKGGSAGSEVPGVVFAGDDFTANALRFTEAVADVARNLGVDFRLGSAVRRIAYLQDSVGEQPRQAVGIELDTQCIPADDVVLACGVHTPALTGAGQWTAPIQPLRGFSIELSGCRQVGDVPIPDVCLDDTSSHDMHYQLTPLEPGKLRIVGFIDLMGFNRGVPPKVTKMLEAHTRWLLPDLRWESASPTWCGLRPMTPDSLPYVGREIGSQNVWLCAGHGATGWTTCAATAELLAEQMFPAPVSAHEDCDSEALRAALNPHRFAGKWMSSVFAAVFGVRSRSAETSGVFPERN